MSNRKGFTLIELLAIIVILAIIAVITVPIILNIIENSKKGAVVDSIYGYKDALQKYYMNRSVSDANFEGPTGIYDISDLPSDFSVSGEEPSEGWVELEKGKVVNYSLKYGDYVVSLDTSTNMPVAVKNGEVSLTPIEAIAADLNAQEKSDGAYYVPSTNNEGVSIYFNPTSNETCDSSESVSTVGNSSGCMHWYLYSIKGNYANLLLDHNITEIHTNAAAWALEDDYVAGLTPIKDSSDNTTGYQIGEGVGSKAVSAGITYPNTVTSFTRYGTYLDWNMVGRGPVTALNSLKSLTVNWRTGIPKVPNASGIDEHIVPSSANFDLYQINYADYHARLITYEEIGYLGCTDTQNSCPEWMIKSTYGEDKTTYAGMNGYWTSTPNVSQNVTNTSAAWIVFFYRSTWGNGVDSLIDGVRPVITVPIADIIDQL